MNANRSRFTRRALLAGIGQVTMAALVAACGQDSTPAATQAAATQAPGTPQAARTVRPASTARPTSTPILQGEVVVAVATGSYKGWQVLADKYTELHPKARVTIELQQGSAAERDRYYREQLASGVARMSLATVNSLADLYNEQALLNWYPYLARINPYTGEVWQSSFMPDCLSFAQVSADRQYMLSTELFQVLIFFNRALAASLGLNPDEPPKAMNDLVHWAHSGRTGVAGFDIWETGDQLDWLTRIIADPWYATPAYWQLCACQAGDACFDAALPPFPPDDWRSNITYDDPDKVVYNPDRAWEAFDAGSFLGDQDDAFEGLAAQLAALLDNETLPADWRTAQPTMPTRFLASQALLYPAGSFFISDFFKRMQQMAAGAVGEWPQGKQTPTPDPQLMRARAFELGAFPFPVQSNLTGHVQYQRTIEQPAGYWGIPRKLQAQNELEVDFVMFATSPEMVALKLAAELDSENAEGNIIGLSTVEGIVLPDPLAKLFAGLGRQGNIQKPHPLNMMWGGLPSSGNLRSVMLADFLEGTIDAATLKAGLRDLRQAGREDERAAEAF